MATCSKTLSGIIRRCDSNIGGIRRAWIATYDETSDFVASTGKITSIGSQTDQWKEYKFRKQTGSVTTTITRDDANGTLYYESAIVLQFSQQETSKHVEINAIAMSDIRVVIEDNNGRCWFFGKDFPVTLSDGTTETGTALADFNGYNITLNDLSKELPCELSEEAIGRLKGVTA